MHVCAIKVKRGNSNKNFKLCLIGYSTTVYAYEDCKDSVFQFFAYCTDTHSSYITANKVVYPQKNKNKSYKQSESIATSLK